MAYSSLVFEALTFVELPVFTRRLRELLDDDDYALLQEALVKHPDKGKLIPGCGGIRKVRWSLGEHGKSGGARVIYYWAKSEQEILLLFIYPKNEASDLTPDQKKQLKKVIKEEYP